MKVLEVKTGRKITWNARYSLTLLILLSSILIVCNGQDYGTPTEDGAGGGEPPPEMARCNGIFMSYSFGSRERGYPHVKNVTAQSWSFKASAMIVNAGKEELTGWQMFIGFRHKELIVSATGASPMDGDFPLDASNGTTFVGSPNTDLKTSIVTAGDFTQISTNIEITGTLFGVAKGVTPMPKTLKLVNDGWECPAAKRKGGSMNVCCKRNPKFKVKTGPKTKFARRRHGDLNIVYDVLQSFGSNYLAQVTIDNENPIGRLDRWNLTWEWTRGEIINTMRGAYTYKRDPSECLYSKAGQYYKDLDFSQVMNCQKKPSISDLPPERKDDNVTGKLPFCCKNGTLLPPLMDPSKSRSMFQLQGVFAAPTMHLCRPEQRDALLTFKNELEVLNSSFVYNCLINGSLVKPHRKTDSWVSNNDCCNWKGITCNSKSGEVIALNLSCSYLSGRFNSYSSLQNLHSLTTLDLSFNVLSGRIMPSIGNLSQLTSLDLSSNRFSGQIPSSIENFSLITSLDLSFNSFVGQIPSFFGNLNQLTALDASSNAFTGNIPSSLFEIPSLKHVRLENNQLNGTLNFGNISTSKLQELYLKDNNLVGKIPSSICDLRYLIALDLSSNNFTGLIPRCMGNPKCTLLDLNLRQNHLHGDLPKNVCKSLRSLDLSHNQLTGKLPRSWISLSNLQVLKVESNKINDTFPSWLSSLPELKVLVLCSNAFHGPVHQASFTKLQIIDIAHNHFNGTLPSDYFAKWDAMSSSLGKNEDESIEKYVGDLFYQDSMVLRNKGVEMDIARIHKILRALDFSGNKLEGEIPSSIGLLKELQVLSLSNNVFTGHIPSSMGNLTSLESLDVSQNQLSGEIPQELGSLSYLAYMNFSHNQLSGLVPGGTQFRRQNCTSFEDNKGLFGPSLDENCIDIHTTRTSHEQYETLEPEVEVLSWTAAVIGAVPGIVFGFTIGYILFAYKPEWFMNPFGL